MTVLCDERPLTAAERLEQYQTALWVAFEGVWNRREQCPGCMFYAELDCFAMDPRQCPGVNSRSLAAQFRRQAT